MTKNPYNKKISFRGKFFISLGLTFIFLFWFPANSKGSAKENRTNLVALRISEMVGERHVLSSRAGDVLGQLIAEFLSQSQDEEILRNVALGVTKKVVDDAANIRFLLYELDKLVQDDYSAKMGKLQKKDINACWKKLNRLDKEMKAVRQRLSRKIKRKGGKVNYADVLKENSKFLTGKGTGITVAKAWAYIENYLQKSYPDWDAKYTALIIKIGKNKTKKPEDILSNEEVKFLKVFQRLNNCYLKLSGRLPL